MIKYVGSVTPNKIIIFLITPLFLSASLLDFRALDQAQEAYAEGNYSKAIEAYETVEKQNDEAIYDKANSHYKLKEYEKAKELYASINKDSLAFKKWHNLGNCHAQLGKLDEGIKAYEEALAIKEDEDTRFNLELLKKKKKEQEKKDDKKKDKKNKKIQIKRKMIKKKNLKIRKKKMKKRSKKNKIKKIKRRANKIKKRTKRKTIKKISQKKRKIKLK